jgi:hypothetical protein
VDRDAELSEVGVVGTNGSVDHTQEPVHLRVCHASATPPPLSPLHCQRLSSVNSLHLQMSACRGLLASVLPSITPPLGIIVHRLTSGILPNIWMCTGIVSISLA